jgi:hypothetical protein
VTRWQAQGRYRSSWSRRSSAHTPVYDCLISDATTFELLRSVHVPTRVLDSSGSTDDLAGWAATVADQLPHGSHRSLAGEWHCVPDDTLATVLIEFQGGLAEEASSERRVPDTPDGEGEALAISRRGARAARTQ